MTRNKWLAVTAVATVTAIALSTSSPEAGVGSAVRRAQPIQGCWATMTSPKVALVSYFHPDGRAQWALVSNKGLLSQGHGSWRVNRGTQLIQKVIASKIPGIVRGKTHRDIIVSLTRKALTLKAQDGGMKEVHRRCTDRDWVEATNPAYRKMRAELRAKRQKIDEEVMSSLDKIRRAAAAYYTTPRVHRGTGRRIPCQFPGRVDLTPARSCCDRRVDRNGNRKCDVSMANWSHPTWRALGFSLGKEHVFRYTFESSGTLAQARYTVTAHADLDCDGTFSTFQLVGEGDPAATLAECNAVGAPAIFRDQEME